MARCALALLLGLAAALAAVGDANLCYPTHVSSGRNLSQLSDLHACKGVGKWSKLSAIWTPMRIHITCSTSDVSPCLPAGAAARAARRSRRSRRSSSRLLRPPAAGSARRTAQRARPTRAQLAPPARAPQYSVFLGHSEESLEQALGHNDALVWCGLGALSDSRNCTKNISPYGTTLVGIKMYGGYLPRITQGGLAPGG
jgi:hypothetical protein